MLSDESLKHEPYMVSLVVPCVCSQDNNPESGANIGALIIRTRFGVIYRGLDD